MGAMTAAVMAMIGKKNFIIDGFYTVSILFLRWLAMMVTLFCENLGLQGMRKLR